MRGGGTRRVPTADRHLDDAYAVLGVDRLADDETIATAHRRLARRHHPDLAGESATRRMMRINAAFDAIRTAAARAAYEATLKPPPPRDGTGGAGPAPGRPSGSVLDFGRHIGWSLGEVGRVDPGYLVWLAERPEGEPYRDEIDQLLERMGFRRNRTHDASAHPWRAGFSRF
jgi:DnaJ-class molecular chaperone